jgi:hypothetical protein
MPVQFGIWSLKWHLIVVEDIFYLKMNTPLNEIDRRGGELKPQGKHGT